MESAAHLDGEAVRRDKVRLGVPLMGTEVKAKQGGGLRGRNAGALIPAQADFGSGGSACAAPV
jgi:hypothetical protein